jgi:ribosomal protein S18 acetylase RimI-like enzyme
MNRVIEELSINAWPALQTNLYDGWVLRFADGYTHRANSANPLYPSTRPLTDKVARVEKLYRGRHFQVTFKMTDVSQPEELDDFLAARGYLAYGYTSVQMLQLKDAPVSSNIELSEELTAEWFDSFCRLSHLAPNYHTTARQLLEKIVPRTGFAFLRDEGEIIACGLGVVERNYLGLFDIVTETNRRRQGYGQQVVQGLLKWGKEQGAQQAYLQVTKKNDPALALYSKLNFRERYQYWYRVKV